MRVTAKVWWIAQLLVVGLALALVGGCQGDAGNEEGAAVVETEGSAEEAALQLPELAPMEPEDGRTLRVVATTSIIGDVVGQVGGEAIELTTLMEPGEDPHSYEPSTADLTRVADADVIFINGWDLEEGLVDDLANIAGDAPLTPISANITPLAFGAHEEEADGGSEEEAQGHEAADPHVWLDPQLVMQWVQNVEMVLSSLDPERTQVYEANAAAYEEELAALDARMEEALGQIPPERRKLVTNHDSLAYFARRFNFEVVGTVIPGASTVSEPSAQALAALVERMREEEVCTIFAETTANARLAETVAAELEGCEEVQVLSLYTGALGEPGSGADSYVGMMEGNLEVIVEGVRG